MEVETAEVVLRQVTPGAGLGGSRRGKSLMGAEAASGLGVGGDSGPEATVWRGTWSQETFKTQRLG